MTTCQEFGCELDSDLDWDHCEDCFDDIENMDLEDQLEQLLDKP